MKVLVAQVLCPARHCLIGLALSGDAGDEAARHVLQVFFEGLVAAREINGHCGLCGATELTYEVGNTRFETIEEARPVLRRLEREQLELRAQMMAAGKAYDARNRRN